MDDYMTTVQAAELLGIDPASVARLIRQGKLHGERFGRAWMVSRRSAEDYLERFGELPKRSPKRRND